MEQVFATWPVTGEIWYIKIDGEWTGTRCPQKTRFLDGEISYQWGWDTPWVPESDVRKVMGSLWITTP